MNTSKGSEEGGALEIKVETVDYRSPAGQNQEPKKENVVVIHQMHKDGDAGTGSGALAAAAAAVAHTFQSAKDAIFGGSKDSTK